jgi:hypothetical protein
MKNLNHKFFKQSNKLLRLKISDDLMHVHGSRVTNPRQDGLYKVYTFCKLEFLLTNISTENLEKEIVDLSNEVLYPINPTNYYEHFQKFDFVFEIQDELIAQKHSEFIINDSYKEFIEKNPEYACQTIKGDSYLFLKTAMGEQAFYDYIMNKVENDQEINTLIEGIWDKL